MVHISNNDAYDLLSLFIKLCELPIPTGLKNTGHLLTAGQLDLTWVIHEPL